MFLKRFSISLIIISTSVYVSIFFMSRQYNTSFFDEMVIQLNRVSTSIGKKESVQYTKIILLVILENEHPPENWDSLIFLPSGKNSKELFYHYKVWTITSELTRGEIAGSYPIYAGIRDGIRFINMRYGKGRPILQFPFFRNKQEKPVTGLFFPINEPPLSADFNKDGTLTHEDVILAKKTK